jgi:peptidoglycan/xylan/chitin deacetylase (PgdA/CDA1 family)
MAGSGIPRGWPAGRPLAVSLSVMLEGWTESAAPGIGPMGNVLKAGVLDLQGRSWAEYGPKEGAWRILDVLAHEKRRAVWYVSGILAERYPDLMREIARQGHVVAAHAWGQEIIPSYQTQEEEARDIDRCVETLTRTTGSRPLGWVSPRCTPSASTTELLAERGFLWHNDFFDADLPRTVETKAGPIVAVPFTMEVNDMPLYIRYGNEPEAYTRVLRTIVEGWQGPGFDGRPGCLDITVHAHVFGRPYGIIELKNSLQFVKRHEDRAWLTDHAELAERHRDR